MVIDKREKNSVVIFDIDGEIRRSDITDVTLHQLVKEELEQGKKHILLNFEKVGFIDSFGVGEILASYISTHNLGGKLKLARIGADYLVYRGGRATVGPLVLGSQELRALRAVADTAVYTGAKREVALRTDDLQGALGLADAIVEARSAA